MSYYEANDHTSETDDDLWHVQLQSGDVCLMTLDQLDDAFQTGVISENTYLWQEGATGWVTLREVAGLDSEDDAEVEIETVSNHQPNPFVQPDYASESVWPQATAAPSYVAQDIYAPPIQMSQDIYAPPLQAMGPHSTAPVVSPMGEMEFDLEPVNFRRKKRSGAKMLFAALLVGGAGFGAVKYKLIPIPQMESPPPVTAAMASPVPQNDIAPTPPTPPTPPPAAMPAPEPAKALTDDVKDRLAKADKVLSEKQKQKQQQAQQRRAAAPHSSRGGKASMGGDKVFHKGGETGDPLNSAL
jgi:hypothetical protein